MIPPRYLYCKIKMIPLWYLIDTDKQKCYNVLKTREGFHMTVKSDKTRTNITFPIQLKEQLEQIAKQENRSFNNLVITVLQDFVKSADK